MGNRHSQSYSLPEGSQQLPKGQALPSADLQPLSHPSGSGEPESHQPVMDWIWAQAIVCQLLDWETMKNILLPDKD
ncbi:hypothetical protein FD755_016554 [Muntiacus reevesi]|uniref:Uncharacterized protein n=1 Tax=Muntiacus reevesi TaxID=9886 RepID=A0A5N3XBU2_MUNRE|nr:hypothetical protein FD755_016554 [Muntiacus reevesi]